MNLIFKKRWTHSTPPPSPPSELRLTNWGLAFMIISTFDRFFMAKKKHFQGCWRVCSKGHQVPGHLFPSHVTIVFWVDIKNRTLCSLVTKMLRSLYLWFDWNGEKLNIPFHSLGMSDHNHPYRCNSLFDYTSHLCNSLFVWAC